MRDLASRFSGVGFVLVLACLAVPVLAGQTVLQPGPGAGKDIWTTSVYSYAPGESFPGGGLDDEKLEIGGWGDLYYALLQFDLTGLPQNATSAHLELFFFAQKGSGPTGLYLDRITQSWDWRTQGTGRDRLRLWWADRPAAMQWIPQALPAPTVGQWYSIDVTDLYNAWQNGTYPNYGLQLRPASGGDNHWAEFRSSDYSPDPTLRPKLVVESADSSCSISGVPLFSQSCPSSLPVCNIPRTCTNKDPINCMSDDSCADTCTTNANCAGGVCSRWSGDPFTGGGPIGLYGCYTSSIAMLINHHAATQSQSFTTTPRLLNNFLAGPCSPDQSCRGCGYDSNGGMNEWAAACYARKHGVAVYYNGTIPQRDDAVLHKYLCGSSPESPVPQPVIFGLGDHFVLATGEAGVGSWSVNDPAGGVVRTRTTYRSLRLFSKVPRSVGPAPLQYSMRASTLEEVPPDTRGFLRIIVDECVPFLVTDPEGRRSGIDPATESELDEIPDAAYLPDEAIADPENPGSKTSTSCVFEVVGPLEGAYKVQLGKTDGATYTASFYQANHSEGASRIVETGPPAPGIAPLYLVTYSGGPGEGIGVQRIISSSVPAVPALTTFSTAALIVLLGLVLITSLKSKSDHTQ